jgi:23S rRNA (uracil1939-C5)-methyltransferase
VNTTGTFKITIDNLVYGGSGLGRHEGKVVFVPFSVPGDQLLVRLVEEKKKFARAEIVRILRPGPSRVAPLCSHFMKCGGCQWQQLEYSNQVEAKRKILEEMLHHRFPETRELPISLKASPQPYGYRSRARIQLRGTGDKSSVGFFRCGSHTVEDVESCPLLRPSLNKALGSVRQFKYKVDRGGRHEMDIACSEADDFWTTVHAGSNIDEEISSYIGTGKPEELLLHRSIGEFRYSVTAPVFFQANDFMVGELVSLVRASAKNAGCNSAVDLFAGVGLFTLPLALQFRKVLAVENSRAACRLCSTNASEAKLSNIQLSCSDVFEWMNSAGSISDLDLVLLDPPRTGAGTEVIGKIRELSPRTIIYVSCDPQTLCRDIAELSTVYTIDLAEGLDMFPQTYHFETVVRLIKNQWF